MKQASLFSFFKGLPSVAAGPAKDAAANKENSHALLEAKEGSPSGPNKDRASPATAKPSLALPPSPLSPLSPASLLPSDHEGTDTSPALPAAEETVAPAVAQQTLKAELACPSAAVVPSSSGSEDHLSAFERLRLENIRRNKAFLSALGLDDTKPICAVFKPAVNRAKRARLGQPSSSAGPSRRSARVANAPAVVYDAFSADATNKSNEEEEEEEEEEGDGGEVEDSAVLRYVMGCGPHNPIPSGRGGPSVISELRMRYPEPFKADQLKAVYSLEFHPHYSNLLLAAGKQGFASLFKMGDDGADVLLSFKAHSTWVSTAMFVPAATGTALRVLTSSDDSLVKLWDFSKCDQRQVPSLISSNNKLHSRGIYSMDVSANGSGVLTASKDGSVVYSRFNQSGDTLVLQTVYDEMHSMVVKTVAWQRGHNDIFASGGQDRRLCLCDIRQPPSSAVVIADAHGPSGGVHTVRWSPEGGSAPLLMSAAMGDASIKVWDTRVMGEGCRPVHEVRGHHNTRLKPSQLKDIISPSFLGTRYILSGGQQSDSLSLFSLDTGACVSRGDIGFSAYSLGCSADMHVAVAGRTGQLLYLQAA